MAIPDSLRAQGTYNTGFKLAQGTYLSAGTVTLSMQGDGNLVLYNNWTTVLWSSGTGGHNNCGTGLCYAVLQSDGNFVVYDRGTALWSSGTSGNAADQLVFSSQWPYLQILNSSGSPLWSDSISAGNLVLEQGQWVTLGNLELSMQTDGNLVLYQNWTTVLWTSNTGGHSCGTNQCYAVFQGDGDLVVYQGTNPLWAAGVGGATLSFSASMPYLSIAVSNNGPLAWITVPSWPPAVWMNVNGRLEVFYQQTNTGAYHSWQQTAAIEQGWASNASLGGGIIGVPAAASFSDGRLAIFVEGLDANVYYNYQLTPGGGWSGWIFLGGGPVSQPPSAIEASDGTIAVFAIRNGVVYTNEQLLPGGSAWSGWIALGGASIATTPSAVLDYAGNLYIFAQGTDQAGWYSVRSGATGAWGGWSSLGGGIVGSPHAALNQDGRVAIFAEGGGNYAYYNEQNPDGSTWGGWTNLGGYVRGAPTVVANESGALEVFALSSGDAIWHNWQTSPDGTWSGWNSLGGNFTSSAGVFRNVDGRVEIFAQNAQGVVSQDYQLSPGGAWSGWFPIGGSSDPTPSQSTPPTSVSGAFGGLPSDSENDAFSIFGRKNNACTPTLAQNEYTWPCGSVVGVSFVHFSEKQQLALIAAVNNWNTALRDSALNVQFVVGPGDGVHSITVRYKVPVADPGDNVQSNRTQGYTHLIACNTPGPGGVCNHGANNALLHVDIDINSGPDAHDGITTKATLTNTLAHEIGHTFQLADCPVSGNKANPYCNFPSIMQSAGAVNAAVCNLPQGNPESIACTAAALNTTQGAPAPTCSDIAEIAAVDAQLAACQVGVVTPPTYTCVDGSSPSVATGFAFDGTPGEPVTSCDGVACDACNSNCNSFLGSACGSDNTSGGTGGSGSGGSGSPCGAVNVQCAAGIPVCDGITWQCSVGVPCQQPEPAPCYQGAYVVCDDTGWVCIGSPITVDVLGDGFHFTDITGGVPFRVMPGGALHQMAWPDAAFGNGWLALDRDGDGMITSFQELFGDATPQPATPNPNGYLALAVFDDPANGGNGNGFIDQGDAVFSHLLMWVDDNHNGVSEASELHSLPEVGIFKIDLNYHRSDYVDENGNRFRYKSRIWDEAGKEHDTCYDVFVRIAN